MKAKYIGSYIFQNRKYLEYEYRGCKYSVCADWNAEPLPWQHKSEQFLIDRQLDQNVRQQKTHKLDLVNYGTTLRQETLNNTPHQ